MIVKKLSIAILSLLASIITTGQSKGFEFDTLHHGFGSINRGSPCEFTFSFVNNSPAPVAIKGVKASCGCTAASWSKAPVKPEGSGSISVKYNTNVIGVFSKTLAVYTTDRAEPIILTISGEVIKKKK
jgi:hypothetical protein